MQSCRGMVHSMVLPWWYGWYAGMQWWRTAGGMGGMLQSPAMQGHACSVHSARSPHSTAVLQSYTSLVLVPAARSHDPAHHFQPPPAHIAPTSYTSYWTAVTTAAAAAAGGDKVSIKLSIPARGDWSLTLGGAGTACYNLAMISSPPVTSEQ